MLQAGNAVALADTGVALVGQDAEDPDPHVVSVIEAGQLQSQVVCGAALEAQQVLLWAAAALSASTQEVQRLAVVERADWHCWGGRLGSGLGLQVK